MREEPTEQEKKIIAFFSKWLNNARGTLFEPDRWPDSTTPGDIDCVLKDTKTKQEIAVEVSSVWRSESAGREENDFKIWCDGVQERVRGKIVGGFEVYVPKGIQEIADIEVFAREIIACIRSHINEIVRSSPNGMGHDEKLDGIDVVIGRLTDDGSDIGFARAGRFALDPNNVRRILNKKCPKLKKYKEQGLETWLVLENTAWPVTSFHNLKSILKSQLQPEHDHANRIGVIYGNPPDAALIEIR